HAEAGADDDAALGPASRRAGAVGVAAVEDQQVGNAGGGAGVAGVHGQYLAVVAQRAVVLGHGQLATRLDVGAVIQHLVAGIEQTLDLGRIGRVHRPRRLEAVGQGSAG